MYWLFSQIVVGDVIGFIVDVVIQVGSPIVVLAGVAAVIWRWFVRDRWESAVRRAMTSENYELAQEVMNLSVALREHVTAKVQEVREDVEKQSGRIDALDYTVRNGLEARMIRVEKHVEKLVAGQARMEGIMQVMMQQGD